MPNKVYIGLDNGCTASIGVLGLSIGPIFAKPKVKKCANYHKNGRNITRIDHSGFYAWLCGIQTCAKDEGKDLVCTAEKPYTGIATTAILAGRAYESELVAFERLHIPVFTIAASDWQGCKKHKGLLPYGKNTKESSMELGIQLFPSLEKEIRKHGDADGLLIAHWAMENGLW